MSRVPTVRQADLDRVLKALKAAGYGPASIVVRPGGEVVITPGPAVAGNAGALTPEEPAAKPEDLDGWRARKRERGGRAA